MPYEFKHTHRVEFAETDMAGIVHFSNFFRMMEATEHAFFRSLGFTIHGLEDDATVGWPRVSAACDYRSPLRFEEEVEIHLIVAEVLAANQGLGFRIIKAQHLLNTSVIFFYLVVIGALGLACDVAFKFCGSRLFPWTREYLGV